MKDPAEYYGLEITDEVDERYSVEKSTEAICKFIKDGYKKYNSWTLTVACLNYGFGAVEKQIKKQNTEDYFKLRLPQETTRYIYRILALKCIFTNPKRYGFVIREMDLCPEIRTKKITLDSTVTDFVSFAEEQNISYKTFKYFNPWLRKRSLANASKKVYTIILPSDNYSDAYYEEQYEADENFSREDSLIYFTSRDTLKK